MAAAGIDLAARIQKALLERGLRLALAESCTGGYIAHLLTSIPGASDFFVTSIVAYSEEAKIKLLGVERDTIKEHGVISPDCAIEMAAGAARAANTGAALSVTGNLGPEPMEGKEVGLIHAAVYLRDRTMAREFRFQGERNEIKEKAGSDALEMLYEAVTTWD
jgi:PncC family amidohydrolase